MTQKLDEAFCSLAKSSVELTDQAFDELLPAVAAVMSRAGTPEQALGVVQALFRLATVLSYSTIGTPLDTLIRSADEAGALGSAHWKAATHLHALVKAELERHGKKVPPELTRALQAAPAPATGASEAVDAASMPEPQKLAERMTAEEVPADDDAELEMPDVSGLANLINSRGGES